MVRRYYSLPSLSALAAFEAAARHLSLTKAAEELNVTTGAVSRSVRALEDELGHPLFVRRHRAVELTREGETLAAALHESFEMTSGYFWPMLLCVLGVALPLWILDGWLQQSRPDDDLTGLALSSLNGFLQLFSTVLVFRLFMLRSALPARD